MRCSYDVKEELTRMVSGLHRVEAEGYYRRTKQKRQWNMTWELGL